MPRKSCKSKRAPYPREVLEAFLQKAKGRDRGPATSWDVSWDVLDAGEALGIPQRKLVNWFVGASQ